MDLLDNDNLKENWRNFKTTVETWNLRHFTASEFCRINRGKLPGPDRKWPTHTPPPGPLHENLRPTAMLADEIRERWGSAVSVVSGYRPDLYNLAVGGAPESQHLFLRALDLQPTKEGFNWPEFRQLVEEFVAEKRNQDGLIVGLFIYPDADDRFVHIDTGRYNYNRGDVIDG